MLSDDDDDAVSSWLGDDMRSEEVRLSDELNVMQAAVE